MSLEKNNFLVLEEKGSPFPPLAQKVLDTFYASQRIIPKTDSEKIVLLKSLTNHGYIPGSFKTYAEERKIYEFHHLTNLGIL